MLATPVAVGHPTFYSETPPSLVTLERDEARVPLSGRRPIGIHGSVATPPVELVDRNLREIIVVDEGGVQSRNALPLGDDQDILAAVRHDDSWYVLVRADPGEWTVHRFDPRGRSVGASSALPRPEGNGFRMGAVGNRIVLIGTVAPHRVISIRADDLDRWEALDPIVFLGSPRGRTVALPPLDVGGLALITIVDQATPLRTLRLLDLEAHSFRDSLIEFPLAFVSVGSGGQLFGVREAGTRALVTFSWSLSDRPCVRS